MSGHGLTFGCAGIFLPSRGRISPYAADGRVRRFDGACWGRGADGNQGSAIQRRKSSGESRGAASGGGGDDGVGSTGGGVAVRGAAVVRLCSWAAFAGVPPLGAGWQSACCWVFVSRLMW